MKLYEINEKLASCVVLNDNNAVDMETGEIISIEALKNLEMERNEKIENIAKWYINLQADAKAMEEREKYFAARKKAAKNKMASLKEFLAAYLEGKKFKTNDVNITFKKSQRLAFTGDIDDLPINYVRTKMPELDKVAITKALKEGAEIAGCSLTETMSIVIK